MKNKPFLISAIVFGGLGLLVLLLTVISFFEGDNLISGAIASLLNLSKDSFNDATMAQVAVVFFIPTFIFAFRTLADEDEATANKAISAETTSETPITVVRDPISVTDPVTDTKQSDNSITEAEVTEDLSE